MNNREVLERMKQQHARRVEAENQVGVGDIARVSVTLNHHHLDPHVHRNLQLTGYATCDHDGDIFRFSAAHQLLPLTLYDDKGNVSHVIPWERILFVRFMRSDENA